jgi:hypothetical protein
MRSSSHFNVDKYWRLITSTETLGSFLEGANLACLDMLLNNTKSLSFAGFLICRPYLVCRRGGDIAGSVVSVGEMSSESNFGVGISWALMVVVSS